MKVIVTGSFDPITVGHIDVIKQISDKYDEIYVVALINEKKSYMFTMEQKKRLMEISLMDFPNVIVDAYDSLTADYMHKHGIFTIIRGIRNDDDLLYEKELAAKMNDFDGNFETVIVKCKEQYAQISSTMVRERILNKSSLNGLVDPRAEKEIYQMLATK